MCPTCFSLDKDRRPMWFLRTSMKATGKDARTIVWLGSPSCTSTAKRPRKEGKAGGKAVQARGRRKTACVHGEAPRQPELLLSPRAPWLNTCLFKTGSKFGLTEIWLRHGHGPLGCWCRSGSRVEVHMIQRLIHRLPRVLPCGDFFYVTKKRKTIICLIISIIIIIAITNNSTTVKWLWLFFP